MPADLVVMGDLPVFSFLPTRSEWAAVRSFVPATLASPLSRDSCAKQCANCLREARVAGDVCVRGYNLSHSLRSAMVTALCHVGVSLAGITDWGGWRLRASPKELYVRGAVISLEPYMRDCLLDAAASVLAFGGVCRRLL
jgi:hypothetical protein